MQEVTLDPLFHDLLKRYELASRRFRSAVIDLRAFYYRHTQSPKEESYSDKWRGALLNDALNLAQVELEAAQSHLTRYGAALVPHSSESAHLASIDYERQSQLRRLHGRGHGRHRSKLPDGPEVALTGPDGVQVLVILRVPE